MTVSLVTGGAGFIGSHVVDGLVSRGDQVRVLDNFSTGKSSNLTKVEDQIEIIEGDVRDIAQVESAIDGVHNVFHFAAFVSVPLSLEQPKMCYDVNVQGTTNVLEAARITEVPQMVLASSAAVYGNSEDSPLKEDSELMSLSPYAASKRIDELLAKQYSIGDGLSVVTLRFFNVFGPRQSPDSAYAAAIPIFIQRLLDNQAPIIFGNGKQVRDFIYVGDVVRASLIAAEAYQAGGKVFNICTGNETSILNLLEILKRNIFGSPDPKFSDPRPGDVYRSLGNPASAARDLGFQAETSLQDGLAQTIKWMQA